MSHLLLLSGGIESTTLLHGLRHKLDSWALRALFIDYGQRAARPEFEAAAHHARTLEIVLDRLDMAAVGVAFRARQTHKLHVPLPQRNLVALSLGFSFAETIGASSLYLALNREDTVAYASASVDFVADFKRLARRLAPITLETPLIDKSKADIVRVGIDLGIDYARTYSCLLGYARHCGRCPQCRKRREAFATANQAEPQGFYRA